ncbi:MAG: protocatechuate dioxygenase [Actinomycetota bacterium]|nr:protocatechuate dioxygenase [Actinomycetota bacterium]MDQ3640857.1 protocatechuate dioxygenase [Actinomycetota bacterium]
MTAVGEPVTEEIAALLDGCTSRCQLLAEQEEGPYRRDEQPRRRDVTEGHAGSPLRLGLRLRTYGGDAVAGADVEIWHCDAYGRYSGYPPHDPTVAVDPSPQRAEYLPDETFLRGRQTTDDAGDLEFRTVYPGWYSGRTVHIHLMVHTPARSYISQLYFPEDVTAEVFAHDPYRHHGLPDTTHATDEIFPTGGQPAVLDIHADGGGHVGAICLQLADHEAP